jgi:hypothetical protein
MMPANASAQEGLLVRAEPLEWAEEIFQRMVHVERTGDGALLIDADPAWAGAINTVLVSKGVKVSELVRSSRTSAAPPFADLRTYSMIDSQKGVRRRWSSQIAVRSRNLRGS